MLPRFRAAHTQVLGVSVDSVFCHANWAASMGGVSFPLLADFHLNRVDITIIGSRNLSHVFAAQDERGFHAVG